MAEADEIPVRIDNLLTKAEKVVEGFRNAPVETQREQSAVDELVRLFKALEKERKRLQEMPELADLHRSASKVMLSLNHALRKRSNIEPGECFLDLYHYLVVVDPEPDLLENEGIREESNNALIEARKIGLRLCEDVTFRAGLEDDPVKKMKFFERLAKVCRAHERYACVNAGELPGILAEASTFEGIAETVRQEIHAKVLEVRNTLREIENWLASKSTNFEECLQCASRLAELFKSGSLRFRAEIRKDVVNAFKRIKKARSNPDRPCGAGLQLSRALLVLNEALRSRSKEESGMMGRFDDLYEFHECVRIEQELLAEPQIRRNLQACIREAYQMGFEILADTTHSGRLDQDPNRKGLFLSRLGEICRVHAVYDCVYSSELPAILQQGIKFFEASEKVHAQPKGEHLDFSRPRTAECQMRIGRHVDAIQTLIAVSNPGNGIKPATAWESRLHLAECHQVLGREARVSGGVKM